jgi:hypothetical protein
MTNNVFSEVLAMCTVCMWLDGAVFIKGDHHLAWRSFLPMSLNEFQNVPRLKKLTYSVLWSLTHRTPYYFSYKLDWIPFYHCALNVSHEVRSRDIRLRNILSFATMPFVQNRFLILCSTTLTTPHLKLNWKREPENHPGDCYQLINKCL